MAYVTQEQLLTILRKRVTERKSQSALAKEIGVKPQNLSVMVNGGNIHGKVLTFLGFERVDGLYRRRT